MKKTVIISPYVKGVSGTLEQEISGDTINIHIVLNHPDYGSDSIIRLYALSTAHAAKMPYLAEIYDGSAGELNACIRREDIAAVGYVPEDIDTYLLTKYTTSGEIPLAGAFLGLEWCAARFLQKSSALCNEEDEQIREPKPDTPLEQAKELLSSRCTKTISDEMIDAIIGDFTAEVKEHYAVALPDNSIYNWFRIDKDVPIGNLSAVAHILGGGRTRSALRTYGYYIVGIHRSNKRHIAVGIPSDRQNCPTPQVSDCSAFSDGYHITGIFLANDGQYFEKYLQN